MLYISRMIGREFFGVVDTDDGSEEVIGYGALTEATCTLGISIKGVTVDGDVVKFIREVDVYQPPETKSVKSTKTHMLKHIEVTTHGDLITGIYWRQPNLVNPVKIRLSDFGSRCTDYLFTHVGGTKKSGKVTVILDDKVELSDQSFCFRDDTEINLGYIGVVVDMREITDARLLERAYKILYHGGPFPIGDVVIDEEGRKMALLEKLYGEE